MPVMCANSVVETELVQNTHLENFYMAIHRASGLFCRILAMRLKKIAPRRSSGTRQLAASLSGVGVDCFNSVKHISGRSDISVLAPDCGG